MVRQLLLDASSLMYRVFFALPDSILWGRNEILGFIGAIVLLVLGG